MDTNTTKSTAALALIGGASALLLGWAGYTTVRGIWNLPACGPAYESERIPLYRTQLDWLDQQARQWNIEGGRNKTVRIILEFIRNEVEVTGGIALFKEVFCPRCGTEQPQEEISLQLRTTQSEFVQRALEEHSLPSRAKVIRVAIDFAMQYTAADEERARTMFTVIRGCTTSVPVPDTHTTQST
eukprot:CAMPEP_0177680304 /NCGR_PEP_ID=MMETSP0447-20121125/30100_1 /TAXON_ID=0 /ORGANISM="Stygamoeba regulata, Strain BSH-02190019" /LENGTH=184 /DNA_ID=CAMNT_0019189623 /DNA_START=387 /DNA_END=941 /DNA_ORIENTATION=+